MEEAYLDIYQVRLNPVNAVNVLRENFTELEELNNYFSRGSLSAMLILPPTQFFADIGNLENPWSRENGVMWLEQIAASSELFVYRTSPHLPVKVARMLSNLPVEHIRGERFSSSEKFYSDVEKAIARRFEGGGYA